MANVDSVDAQPHKEDDSIDAKFAGYVNHCSCAAEGTSCCIVSNRIGMKFGGNVLQVTDLLCID